MKKLCLSANLIHLSLCKNTFLPFFTNIPFKPALIEFLMVSKPIVGKSIIKS